MVSAIQIGFYIAGIFNLCSVVPSRFFTDRLADVDVLFNGMGCKVICLWGLAYMALAERFEVAPLVSLVFGLEKLYYVIHWLLSIPSYDLSNLKKEQPEKAMFFATYGLGDFMFAIFFLYVAFLHSENLFGPLE